MAEIGSRRGRGSALYEEIKARVLDGTYGAGTPLPSTRACAAERGLSRTTVSTVYEQLAAEGFIETRTGASSRVAAGVMAVPSGRAAPRRGKQFLDSLPEIRLSAFGERVKNLRLPSADSPPARYMDFKYGPLSGGDFPTLAWMKASRRVERERPPSLAYADPRGDLGLRRVLQSYVARARGINATWTSW